jgi:cytochrome c biogenesis protein CcmG/thiol:disulfide interchange protein DsbE
MNWKRASIAVVLLVPVIGLLAFGLTRDPKAIVSPLPGKVAPEFSLAVFAPGEGQLARGIGDTVRIADYRGKVVVLNFWASWCLQCRDEHVDLSNTARAYHDRGVQFYGVLYNDQPSFGLKWIEEMGGQAYPSLLDPRTRTAIDYGPLRRARDVHRALATGASPYKHIGPISERLLSQKIDSLLREGSGTP